MSETVWFEPEGIGKEQVASDGVDTSQRRVSVRVSGGVQEVEGWGAGRAISSRDVCLTSICQGEVSPWIDDQDSKPRLIDGSFHTATHRYVN